MAERELQRVLMLPLARLICLLLAAGCTPLHGLQPPPEVEAGVSPNATEYTAPADSGLDTGLLSARAANGTGERCESEEQVRCAAAARGRERCDHGYWIEIEACPEGQVCGAGESSAPAQCLEVAEVCRGNAGAMQCDGSVLYRCSDTGLMISRETCTSERHCQLGVVTGKCASCVAGEFRCDGDQLQVCDASGRSFRPLQTCGSGTCDASMGLCRGTACSEARSVCQGDTLMACKAGETVLREVARCEPGLCNAAGQRCDACVPGSQTCSRETALSCAPDGGKLERKDCAAEHSRCVGAGKCLQCVQDSDCAAPSCQTAYCDSARGVCETKPLPARTLCPEGLCSGDGACVACLTAADCPAHASCEEISCAPQTHTCLTKPIAEGTSCGGSGTCDGMGKCVGCIDDSDCPIAATCQARQCQPSTHTCEIRSSTDGAACNAAFGDGHCQSGRCVQCSKDADCSGASGCEQAFCRSADATCQKRPAAENAACGGGQVCDGAGNCVACNADAQCGNNTRCVAHQCRCETGHVPNPTGRGCNFDECARFDDNRCGAADGTGNSCINTVDGYDCACGPGYKSGKDQCYEGGGGVTISVPNGASWNVFPFSIVCNSAFDKDHPCNLGNLTWLTVCGLPETTANDCRAINANENGGLAVTNLKPVQYKGALEDFPGTEGGFINSVRQPNPGDVLVMGSLGKLHIMRIVGFDENILTYEWANIWRDTCFRPGGTCTASCSCPGGN